MTKSRIITSTILIGLVGALSSCGLINPSAPEKPSNPVTKELQSTTYTPSGYSVVDSMNKYQIPTTFETRMVDDLDVLALTIDMTGVDPYDLDEHLLGSVMTTCKNKETDLVEITMVLNGKPGEPSTYLCSELGA